MCVDVDILFVIIWFWCGLSLQNRQHSLEINNALSVLAQVIETGEEIIKIGTKK